MNKIDIGKAELRAVRKVLRAGIENKLANLTAAEVKALQTLEQRLAFGGQ